MCESARYAPDFAATVIDNVKSRAIDFICSDSSRPMPPAIKWRSCAVRPSWTDWAAAYGVETVNAAAILRVNNLPSRIVIVHGHLCWLMEGQQVALSVAFAPLTGQSEPYAGARHDSYQANLAIEQRLKSPRKCGRGYGLTSTERATLRPDSRHCAR